MMNDKPIYHSKESCLKSARHVARDLGLDAAVIYLSESEGYRVADPEGGRSEGR